MGSKDIPGAPYFFDCGELCLHLLCLCVVNDHEQREFDEVAIVLKQDLGDPVNSRLRRTGNEVEST